MSYIMKSHRVEPHGKIANKHKLFKAEQFLLGGGGGGGNAALLGVWFLWSALCLDSKQSDNLHRTLHTINQLL